MSTADESPWTGDLNVHHRAVAAPMSGMPSPNCRGGRYRPPCSLRVADAYDHMVVSIAVFDAGPGDAIVVQTRQLGGPWTAVIDGGPPGTPARGMTEYLLDIAPPPADVRASAVVDLLAVSHIDNDHIGGAIDLLASTPVVANTDPPGIAVHAVWHNSFAALTRDKTLVASATLRDRVNEHLAAAGGSSIEAMAVVASVPQGIRLSSLVADNGLARNPPFGRLIIQGDVVDAPGGLRMTVVGPSKDDIEALRRHWMREVDGDLNANHQVVHAAASLDRSVPNLASLVFLLEHQRRRVLFTGDARGDRVVEQLEELGLLTRGKIEVDALKVPHHGSERSCTPGLFAAVRADHYLISGDGTNSNPSPTMIDRLCAARHGEPFTVWLTHDVPSVTARLRAEPNVALRLRPPASSCFIVDL